MGDESKDEVGRFGYYDESEWRIVYTSEIADGKKVIDPRKTQCPDTQEYFNSLDLAQQKKLKYLMPLDGWLACIVYPTTQLKNMAYDDPVVRQELERITGDTNDHGNKVDGRNWPMEITLDMCRNL